METSKTPDHESSESVISPSGQLAEMKSVNDWTPFGHFIAYLIFLANAMFVFWVITLARDEISAPYYVPSYVVKPVFYRYIGYLTLLSGFSMGICILAMICALYEVKARALKTASYSLGLGVGGLFVAGIMYLKAPLPPKRGDMDWSGLDQLFRALSLFSSGIISLLTIGCCLAILWFNRTSQSKVDGVNGK